ncbi:MAG: BTAD domain-containing putative transcriptional regulator [Catenulispora sp.]
MTPRQSLEYRLLGPVEVRRGEAGVKLAGRKTRSVLAKLAMSPNQVIPTDRLIMALWGENTPPTAVSQLHKCVSQLRTALGPDRVIRRGNGYELRLGRDRLDLDVFEDHVRSARAAQRDGRHAEAAHAFRQALSLWRGEPLADCTEELARERPALLERKVRAHIGCLESDLALGRHADVVGELSALVSAHPLREQLRGLLMVALYRSGRVAEALTVYHDGRALLATELGLDPGPEIQELHQAILAGELAGGPAGEPDGAPLGTAVGVPAVEIPIPYQLPPSIPDFTGRAEELAVIRTALTQSSEGAPVLMAVSGRGGIGKTALAVRAASGVADSFPDGHLYAQLHGPDGRRVDPHTVLGRFLRALGVERDRIPDDIDERIQLLRSRSARRRILILLDDAANEAQIRPLLPNSPDCAVLITSRPRLSGLEGAQHLSLDVFDPEESIAFLRAVARDACLGLDRGMLRAVARHCDNLPLALRIIGARLAHHSPGDAARYLRTFADEETRLDTLVAGDLEVRRTIASSYCRLKHPEQDAFRQLSQLDDLDFSVQKAVLTLDVPPRVAQTRIEGLVDARLLDVSGTDASEQARYRFPTLVLLYARERMRVELAGR